MPKSMPFKAGLFMQDDMFFFSDFENSLGGDVGLMRVRSNFVESFLWDDLSLGY